MDAFLEKLLGEFPEYEASFGFVKTGTGEQLSKDEFEADGSLLSQTNLIDFSLIICLKLENKGVYNI